MNGMDRNTGKALSGIAHCKQSIVDILTTQLNTRVMRRTYGSELFDLTDAPMNQDTRMRLIKATAEALELWEPRIQVQTLTFSVNADGQTICDLTGIYLPDGTPVTLNGIVIS